MKNNSGYNMMDVKIRNRALLLNLVYRANGISRKEIAASLGLTPAAITLIVNDMIDEGILSEEAACQVESKRGRKEISLKIQKNAFAAAGIYISQHKFQIICTDLAMNALFSETVYTADCHQSAELLLPKIASMLGELLKIYDVLRTHKLVGIGVSINGIVDSENGISRHSYYIVEDNTDISGYLENVFHVPVILTNNICSLAHAESFLSDESEEKDILVIKYGPGVGGAVFSGGNVSGRSRHFTDVQVGHLIVEANGQPCICGNCGCLETIASYDAIEQTLSGVFNSKNAPVLWKLAEESSMPINMDMIMKAFEEDDTIVVSLMERVTYYLALAVKNTMEMFAPKKTILYGSLFQSEKFREELLHQLNKYTNMENVTISKFNMELDTLGPLSTAISNFLDNGGQISV